MFWATLIGSLYFAGVIHTLITSAKYKERIEREWISWKFFTFAWPLVVLDVFISILWDLPGRFSAGLDRLHDQFSQWLNSPKQKKPLTKGEDPPFIGSYRDSAGVKCPSCHRNV